MCGWASAAVGVSLCMTSSTIINTMIQGSPVCLMKKTLFHMFNYL